MIKLIVADFDGTLVPYGEETVSARVRALIESALEKNITFAVSSGRTYNELAAHLPEFVDRIYFVCCDGAYYVKNGKTLYEKQIRPTDLDALIRQGGEDASYILHAAFQNYGIGTLPDEGARFEPRPMTRAEARFPKEKLYKITAYGAKGQIPSCSELRMHWDGGPNAASQYVNRYADKGIALSNLQMRLMATKFETACIGDSGNDVAMMHNAKYAFCVGTRCKELASACTNCSANVEEALLFLLNQTSNKAD